MATNVITSSNSRTNQLADGDASPVLLVTEGAYIISTGVGNPAYYATGGNGTITIKGTVMSTQSVGGLYLGQNESATAGGGNIVDIASSGLAEGLNGVSAFGGGNQITNEGAIRGTGTSDPNGGPDSTGPNHPGGIYELGDNNYVFNSGTITGFYGILTKGNDETIINSGTITSTATYGIYFAGTANIKNSGTIHGDIAAVGSSLTLTNTGLIDGGIEVGGGSNITNYGTIESECYTANGSSGDSFIVNFGTMYSLVLSPGHNTVQNKSTGVMNDVDFGGSGGNSGDMDADSLVNDGDLGFASFDISSDSFTNTGIVRDGVSMGDGNNTVTNYGEIDDNVSAGSGTDTIQNFGKMVSVFSGAGSDILTNSSGAVISSSVAMSSGATDTDSFINNGTVGLDLTGLGAASVAFGNGGDTLTNSGTIYAQISMSGGDDTVDNSQGSIFGLIDLGAGNDIYTGGDGVDRVMGGAGIDTIDFYGGNDVFYAVNNDGNDVLDGGDGINTYNASKVTGAITIDLGSDVTSGTIGTDTIIGFQRIVGGSGNDTLTGSDDANRIDGGAGNDTINGEAGNDRLIGGLGKDTLIAGIGRDVMTGGSLSGSKESDTFVFADGSSGTAASTRDVITDFTDHGSASGVGAAGADLIDLSGIDANTAVAGDQAFSFNDTKGAAFSGAADSLIYQQYSGYALISGDTNGDGKADFTLQLNGAHTLFASDFRL